MDRWGRREVAYPESIRGGVLKATARTAKDAHAAARQ